MVVPIGTALLGLGWFGFDPSPEPVVVVLGALLASYVVYVQRADRWYSVAQGYLFVLSFRGMSEETLCTFARTMPTLVPFIIKWQVQGEGEFCELFLDVVGEVDPVMAKEIAREAGCKLYAVKRNGHLIWEATV
jgi:hypothetical protein